MRQFFSEPSLRTRLIFMFWILTIIPLIILTISVYVLLYMSINIGVNQHLERGLNAALAIADQSYQESLRRISFITVDLSYAPELRNMSQWNNLDSLFTSALDNADVDGLELYDKQAKLILFTIKPTQQGIIRLTEKKYLLDGMKASSDVIIRSGENHRVLKTCKTVEDDWGNIIGMLVSNKVFPEDYMQNLNTLEQNTRFYAEVDLKRGYYFKLLFAFFLGTAGLVIILAVIMAFFLSRKFTDPIAELVVATHEIAHGNIAVHLKQIRKDEIGELIEAFNKMSHDLVENRQKLINAERIAAWQGIARRLAHEIKNPLTPIQLSIQHLKDEYEKNSQSFGQTFMECTDTIIQEVNGIRTMLQEFSEFARMPSPAFQILDIGPIIKDLISFYSTARSTTRFKLTLENEPIIVQVDSEKIRRCLINLIENGIDAMKKTTEKMIHISVKQNDQNQIMIRVQDTGEGISKENLARIFQPYFTTKENGTGLGLAIVDRIIQDHDGKISVESEEGNGATFIITLPERQKELIELRD